MRFVIRISCVATGVHMASRLISLRLIRPGRKPAVVNTGRSR
jgi:hypothetical protein